MVTHHTIPLYLVLSGNHCKLIQFKVISSPGTLLVLGHSWLNKQRLDWIDWSDGRIITWSPLCYSSCLNSALPPTVSASAPPTLSPPDLSSMPHKNHDLAEVFRKDQALSLPPHRPYACATDLLPGPTLPSGRLYNLSHPEREVMEKYISESLAAVIIRPGCWLLL